MAANEEGLENKENGGKGGAQRANKGKKKKETNETGVGTGEVEQVAVMQEKQSDSRRLMGQTWSNAGLPKQRAPPGCP